MQSGRDAKQMHLGLPFVRITRLFDSTLDELTVYGVNQQFIRNRSAVDDDEVQRMVHQLVCFFICREYGNLRRVGRADAVSGGRCRK